MSSFFFSLPDEDNNNSLLALTILSLVTVSFYSPLPPYYLDAPSGFLLSISILEFSLPIISPILLIFPEVLSIS